jgi:hypothetical protein
VGHNPDPLPEVRRIDGTSRNTQRCCFVTETFQVRKHLVEPQVDEPRHILTKEPIGPENGETADHFRPEIAVIILALSLPGTTEWLARKSSANKVNGLDELPIDAPDVVVTGDVRPVFFEDLPAILVNFDLPGDFIACPF